MLVGNKLDISGEKYNINPGVKDVMVIDSAKCIAMARKIGANVYMECSAKDNDGVKDVFGMAFRALIPGIKHKDPYRVISKVICDELLVHKPVIHSKMD